MPKKLAIAVLVTGALMLPSHEALAHGGGGLGGGQGEGFYGGGSHGRTLEDDFHGSGFGVGANRGGGFGGHHFVVGPGEVGDPYWSPCNYDSYGTNSCGGKARPHKLGGPNPIACRHPLSYGRVPFFLASHRLMEKGRERLSALFRPVRAMLHW